MSPNQYSLAQTLETRPTRLLDWETVAGLNQLTVRSFLTHGWLIELRSHAGLKWTGTGSRALRDFHHGDVWRKHPSYHFTSAISYDYAATKRAVRNGNG